LSDLVDLAKDNDPGLDIEVLAALMARARNLPRDDFELDDGSYRHVLATVDGWRVTLGSHRARDRDVRPDDQGRGLG
jgi:hypothetical protein